MVAAAVYGLPDGYDLARREICVLIRAIATMLGTAVSATPGLIRGGWQFGSARFAAGAVLHQVLRELQLLEAMILHAAELEASRVATATAREGLALAREVQRASSIASLAAVRGFAQAHLERQREHFRLLRHDLRNPLGTIRNAVALLDDPSIPSNLRDPVRFRAIVERNAAQADALVNRDLADGAVLDAALVREEVSVRDVALAVRRALRDEADAVGAEIVVSDELPVIRGDLAALELVLLVATAGALESVTSAAEASRRVLIAPDSVRERSVRIRISGELRDVAGSPGIDLARELAHWAGGELSVAGAVLVELPALAPHPRDDLAGAR